MIGLKHAAALAVILFPSLGFGQFCTGGDVIANPEPFQWTFVNDQTDPHFVGTMEIVEADLMVGGESIHTRIYRQQGGEENIPGPTLRMEPGEKYVLRFRNRLPFEPKAEVHNVFKDPNVSNLHTHGLHISGESPGDDVTRSFEGGAAGDFVYDIPDDHMGGTYWYHAHHHGSTFLQVSAGAFGMIVIDDSGDDLPDTVAAMEERQLVVAYLDPDVAGTGGDTLISGNLSPTWTVNGKVDGTLCTPPNTWQHWRVLLADRDARMKTFSVGSQCEIALMARDGVWRSEVPKALPTNDIELTGASRADLAVRCSADASISVDGQTVANIVIDGSNDSYPNPYGNNGETWFSKRPNYLRDLRSELPADSGSINMGARTINGSKFDPDVPNFTWQTDGVQHFNLKGATNHPFHLHIYHVQVQADCGPFEDGEYYDVIAGNCPIRFDLGSTTSTPYSGRTIMHCHILEHEDQGAMGWANVVGGAAPPGLPSGHGYSDYFSPGSGGGEFPAAPGNLSAVAISDSEIDLNWTDNSDNETLFNIERSLDGSSFDFLVSVGENATSYSDTGLSGNTTYWYRVNASNPDGDSAYSDVASDTTDPAVTGSALTWRSISVSSVNEGKGLKRQRAVVVVEDDTGSLVPDATVVGDFSGSINESGVSATSGPDGSAVLETTASAKGQITFEFCVISISVPGDVLLPFTATFGDACATF